jgi:hypothetical protein
VNIAATWQWQGCENSHMPQSTIGSASFPLATTVYKYCSPKISLSSRPLLDVSSRFFNLLLVCNRAGFLALACSCIVLGALPSHWQACLVPLATVALNLDEPASVVHDQ